MTLQNRKFCSLLLLGGLICSSAYADTAAAPACVKLEGAKQDATTRRESQRLRKTFGIVLPESARVTLIRKTPESKITYLFIEMPSGDGGPFKERLGDGPFPKARVTVSVEDLDCLKRADPSDCTRIGFINTPTDKPGDEIDKWFKEREFQTDAIASFRIGGFKKFASMFLDSKKGLLLLWYKT